jgi:probable HAF family extracellular repeat protein
MKKLALFLLAAASGWSLPARAEVTFEFILEDGYAFDISADGTVVAGNTRGDYEAFRWTAQTGMVRLGQSSVQVLGRSAGTPGVSADGELVASTILSLDSTFVTMGLWSSAGGWRELMPPTPPGGGLVDLELGSVWGMSGDGGTVVGLYWRPGDRAHAVKWTEATGAVDLGSTGRASRADGCNYDGTVIVGWDEYSLGYRRPAAWVNGELTILSEIDGMGEAKATNSDGTVAIGFQREYVTNMRAAALWRRTGGTWTSAQILGVLPGTVPEYGVVIANGVTAAADMVVGYNSFSGDPFYTTGFLWQESTGMVAVEDFLTEHNVLPPGFTIQTLSGITPDGTAIIGFGQDVAAPFRVRSFIIHLDPITASVPMMSGAAQPELLRAGPNPTRGATTLSLNLPQDTSGVLSIIDCNGRLVRRLLSGPLAAGRHDFLWDGRNENGVTAATGIYFTTFNTPTERHSQKLVIVR